jgi:leucyl-tRNA synthetase
MTTTACSTCDPEYYKWGQWMFIQMWKRGLAYRATSPVNWCPTCKTVLANEQVVEGRCWRCGSIPEKRELSQWYLKITDYAQELLDDLDKLTAGPRTSRRSSATGSVAPRAPRSTSSWPPRTASRPPTETISVFTTRADTLFGVSFMVLPPESSLAAELVKGTKYEADYLRLKEATEKVSSVDRQGSDREKHGVFTGRYVINPINGQPAPIWVADYVLLDYGTGAVMGVPAATSATSNLQRSTAWTSSPSSAEGRPPLRRAQGRSRARVRSVDWDQAMAAEGYLVQSGEFTGLKGGKHSEGVKAIRRLAREARAAAAPRSSSACATG